MKIATFTQSKNRGEAYESIEQIKIFMLEMG